MFERLGRRRTIILLALVSITLIALDVRGNRVIDRVRSTAIDASAPLRKAGRTVGRPFANAWHGVTDYQAVKNENDRLHDQLEESQGKQISAEAALRDYAELQAESGLQSVGNIPTVIAQVVGSSPTNLDSTVEINQGSDKGIQVGMPVVTPAGVVGRIAAVTPDRCVVRLISSPEFRVGVRISPSADVNTLPDLTTTTTTPTPPETTTTSSPPRGRVTTTAPAATTTTTVPSTTTTVRTAETGVASGTGPGNPLTIDLVFDQAVVHEGDAVVTSGSGAGSELGSLFPPDLAVGRVTKVQSNTGQQSLRVDVRSPIDLQRLTFVTVLLYSPAPAG
ncbi:MAG: rod shape-determining protein MreC [Acidimicrobiaceae bacterium]|jgi:cell shape-determining protein MreC|nr:rod shape-determining protein MreC [Acidimicrobiaceae bacterium]